MADVIPGNCGLTLHFSGRDGCREPNETQKASSSESGMTRKEKRRKLPTRGHLAPALRPQREPCKRRG